MKILKINNSKSWEICGCDPPIPTDGFGGEKGCPAFASCCEYGDICQIENRGCYPSDRVNGFPIWCPLEEIK